VTPLFSPLTFKRFKPSIDGPLTPSSYKNYLRQCMLTTDFDAGYDAAIAEWNEGCLPFFTAVPNTPPVTPLTATHTPDSCQSAYSLCVMWGDADTSCSSSHASSTAAYSSCVCRSDVLAFASGCEVDGSVNCFRKTPDPATMWGAVYCSVTPGIPSPGGTGPAVVSFHASEERMIE